MSRPEDARLDARAEAARLRHEGAEKRLGGLVGRAGGERRAAALRVAVHREVAHGEDLQLEPSPGCREVPDREAHPTRLVAEDPQPEDPVGERPAPRPPRRPGGRRRRRSSPGPHRPTSRPVRPRTPTPSPPAAPPPAPEDYGGRRAPRTRRRRFITAKPGFARTTIRRCGSPPGSRACPAERRGAVGVPVPGLRDRPPDARVLAVDLELEGAAARAWRAGVVEGHRTAERGGGADPPRDGAARVGPKSRCSAGCAPPGGFRSGRPRRRPGFGTRLRGRGTSRAPRRPGGPRAGARPPWRRPGADPPSRSRRTGRNRFGKARATRPILALVEREALARREDAHLPDRAS